MGLSSVILGHGYKPIIKAIKKELKNGVNFIRPSFIEAEFAEQMLEQIDSAQMVKFAKNGSNVTSGAIRLSRAYTGKQIILRAIEQPFLSIDDWFMGDTKMNSGITENSHTKHFFYNDKSSLTSIIDRYKNKIACLIMEPASLEPPNVGYLEFVKSICQKENIVLIFDEVVSGFRFHPKGAQYLYGVSPDLSTFGKAMANGYSMSALVGKRDIMELGGLTHKQKRVFLLSTTYGAETHHMRASQKLIKILNKNDYEVTKHIWSVGKIIKDSYNDIVKKLKLEEYTKIKGIDCRPYFYFKNSTLQTLFMQEMIKYGVLLQSIMPSYSHRDSEISQTIEAFEKSLITLSKAIDNNNISNLLIGNEIKPVFRTYN
jgi:glutamate-1-semialdehyde 2,1-aminomutase